MVGSGSCGCILWSPGVGVTRARICDAHVLGSAYISSRREERACDTCGFIDARVRDVTQFRTVFKSLGSSG